MINIKKERILLKKTKLPFESEAVLNPAVIKCGDKIHMFYRAVSKNNFSTFGYCILNSPLNIEYRSLQSVMVPDFELEKNGIEDPRIVSIENTFYLTYTSYDGINALGSYATSEDLISWKKQGILVAKIPYDRFKFLIDDQNPLSTKYHRYNQFQVAHHIFEQIYIWNKNLVFFPRKINNKYYILQRIRPDIQLIIVDDLNMLTNDYWENYFLNFQDKILLSAKYSHEISYIGAGCPPIETKEGWLLIYHGVFDSLEGYVYNTCAALLQLDNPMVEIARLPYPLLEPEKKWETKGEVNNVTFPTGAIVENDILYIYYGAADRRIAVASMHLQELISELITYKL